MTFLSPVVKQRLETRLEARRQTYFHQLNAKKLSAIWWSLVQQYVNDRNLTAAFRLDNFKRHSERNIFECTIWLNDSVFSSDILNILKKKATTFLMAQSLPLNLTFSPICTSSHWFTLDETVRAIPRRVALAPVSRETVSERMRSRSLAQHDIHTHTHTGTHESLQPQL